MKTLYLFVGTQAELMKLFRVINEAQSRGIDCKIISTGQNELITSPFLELSKANIEIDISCLNGGQKSTLNYIKWFLGSCIKGRKILKKYFSIKEKSESLFVVHGDTLTTAMGSYICKSLNLPYVHIESGLRSFNLFSPFPEEIDRLYSSKHSIMNFCPGKVYAEYAEKHFNGVAVDTVYNTGIETLYYALNKNNNEKHLFQPNEKYFMFMLHRQENILNKKFVMGVVEQILNMANEMKCVFIYHDQTKLKMEQFGIFEKIKNDSNVILLPRQDYCDFIKLVNYAEFIATDGCGNQQEFYYLGKPYLILRTAVEQDSEGLGWNAKVFNNRMDDILEFLNIYKDYIKPRIVPEVLPSNIIVENIEIFFGRK